MMKRIMLALIAVMALSALLVTYSCARQGGSFGQPITEAAVTPAGAIQAHPEQFAGKRVLVQGKITDECPAGGWFFLKDQTGVIYVNLHPSEFAIPQARGHQVAAQGVVRKEGAQVEIIGEGVELK